MIQLDLTYLESISGGDQSFINEMLTMLLSSTFPEVKILKEHAQNSKWDLMSSTAHKIKAPIQMLGVKEASLLVVELEEIGKAKKNDPNILNKIDQLEAYMKEMELQIYKILKA